MRRPKPAQIRAFAVLLALGATVAACETGGQKKPAPTAGKPQGVANRPREQKNPNTPVKTIDPRDQNANPGPSRTIPIPGQSPNPTAPAPPGALPDPYANPPR